MNLVDRYAEELHRSQQELAGIIDKIRVRKLRLAGQQAVSRMYIKSFTYAVFFLPVASLQCIMYGQIPFNTDSPFLRTLCFVHGERKPLHLL